MSAHYCDSAGPGGRCSNCNPVVDQGPPIFPVFTPCPSCATLRASLLAARELLQRALPVVGRSGYAAEIARDIDAFLGGAE